MQQAKEPIILGIDPGTQVTGYGLIKMKFNGYEALDFGCIRPPAKAGFPEKMLIIFNEIEKLLDTYHPDAVAVETQFVHKNAQSSMKLGMARGIAILAAAKRKISLYEYAPKKAKLAVVGNGAASKEQVQKMIQLLLHLPALPEPEDAADALALALCHAHTLKNDYVRIH
ncbi:MAG TPA: crossover junction endodeoxyribonuclease RuvC [Rhabdochlamydiaceae bacterium]|nr:crossover junction endodeoxyribonuclease RuvC [Rhabdochlamydiaceae bacterium]